MARPQYEIVDVVPMQNIAPSENNGRRWQPSQHIGLLIPAVQPKIARCDSVSGWSGSSYLLR
jgi:hypothetical protein